MTKQVKLSSDLYGFPSFSKPNMEWLNLDDWFNEEGGQRISISSVVDYKQHS